MNNYYLSTSPYPWATDSTTTVLDSLTNSSVPSTLMYNLNVNGDSLLSKPITNIQMSAEGLISFDFMGGTSTSDAIVPICHLPKDSAPALYDMQGRRLSGAYRQGLYIYRRADGTIRKSLKYNSFK